MKVALGTVVYDGLSDEIIAQYVDSVNLQTYKDFDIIIINDGYDKKKLDKWMTSLNNKKHIVVDSSTTNCIYKNRIDLLEFSKKNAYDLLICSDIDDIMCEKRVETYIYQFEEEYILFYNNLCTVEGEPIFDVPEFVEWKDIVEQNFVGLSTSAINMNRLSLDFIFSLREGKTNVFDWYLFSRILLNGEKGKKIKGTYTYYRIYEHNIAGICGDKMEDLQKEIEIKIQHYNLLLKYNDTYKKLVEKYQALDINEIIPVKNDYWWGKIKLLGDDEYEVYL